ncbi:hypothetical protein AVEN_44285-1 [Araneus ventricosus]|uniref:Uncharacterized protein n=1 Tax=Araneus ventricosus TaxID=182803 RepID=A0A4Y2TNV0_ARAVE|nr:hypothetical protein AVEN_229782-1 [Araneus ventricosus]GBO00766.1 hypothetical protein AVEN_44285-1 [Araneus ventricosus]
MSCGKKLRNGEGLPFPRMYRYLNDEANDKHQQTHLITAKLLQTKGRNTRGGFFQFGKAGHSPLICSNPFGGILSSSFSSPTNKIGWDIHRSDWSSSPTSNPIP